MFLGISLVDIQSAGLFVFMERFMSAVQTVEPMAFSCEQFAQLVQISPGMIRKMARTGKIKAIRFGTTWRIPKTELERLFGMKSGGKRK